MITNILKKDDWWKDRIAYQIYPRSFQDSAGLNGEYGDGIGDIPGIISRLDELAELGIGILWLSPVYKSPDADNGYDISDYCSIDPKYGTMADMDRLFEEAGIRDIRIIMDLVINHTSDEHPWFQSSRDPSGPYRDYYIWRSSPNNWTGFFGNDVWEFDESSRLYYLHLFDKKQPDLNHKNPAVTEEVKKIMRFWLDRGASGFRCDVINIIYKTDLEDGRKSIAVRGLEHYKSQEGNHRILRELRRDVLDHYDCFTVGETVMVDLPEAKLLSDRERGELDMLFYFEHLEIDRRIARFIPKKFNASRLLEVLTKWQQGLEWNAVYLENHDQPRIVSHFGSVRYKSGRLDRILTSGKTGSDALEYWKRSAKMLALLELTLRGTVFIYQGQEIGMTNYNFRSLDEVNDVESHNLDKLMKKMHIPSFLRLKWIRESCRDNGRTPMQWNGQAYAGFSKVKPWLPVNPNYPFLNYASQKDDPDSILYFYRKLIGIRKNSDCLKSAGFDPIYADSRVMAYRRKSGSEVYLVVLNFSFRRIKLPKKIMAQIPGKAELFISTAGRTITDSTLLPWEGILVKNSY